MNFERPEQPKESAIERAVEKIIPFHEYKQMRHDTPYVYEVKSKGREMIYYGSGHSVDVEDPMFEDIEKRLSSFLEKHKEDGVVFIEAALTEDDTRGMSKEEAIEFLGESSFTRLLADQAGAEVICPEPSEKEVSEAVFAEGYSGEDYATAFILRSLNYELDTKKMKITYDKLAGLFKEAEQFASTGWIEDFDEVLENLRKLFKKDKKKAYEKFGEYGRIVAKKFREHFMVLTDHEILIEGENDLGFDAEAVEAFSDPVDFSDKNAPTNRISAIMSRARDEVIVKRMGAEMAKGKSIFAVYGASHAVMQEPALRDILEKTKPA